MKSILISIQPQWVEKILNGEKTIEIRKTMPKCEFPCKVYIYETKSKYKKGFYNNLDHKVHCCEYFGKGKVVAEFTLNEVETLWQNNKDKTATARVVDKDVFEKQSCMTWKQYCEYHKCKNEKYPNSYAWHIEDLIVYDKQKELSEFSGFIPNNKCEKHENGFACEKCDAYDKEHETCLALYYCHKPIKRPPQSWCYVEELED